MKRFARAGEAPSSFVWYQVTPPGEWTRDASCRVVPQLADQFTEARSRDEAREGLRICAPCPVRAQCLQYGRDLDADGVWGGELLRNGRVLSQRRSA